MQFQRGVRTVLGTGLETITLRLTKNLSGLCPCSEILSEAGFKSNGLKCLIKEISEQHPIRSVAWLLCSVLKPYVCIR